MGDDRKIMIVGGTSGDAATAAAVAKVRTGLVTLPTLEGPETPVREDAIDRLMRLDPRSISPVVIDMAEMPRMPFLDRGRTWTHPKGPSKEKGPRTEKGRRR